MTFPVGEYVMTFDAPCPGVEKAEPFTVVVRGEEGGEIVIFTQGGKLNALQVSIATLCVILKPRSKEYYSLRHACFVFKRARAPIMFSLVYMV